MLEGSTEELSGRYSAVVRKFLCWCGLTSPAKRDYLIERTIPNPPLVRDETGNVLNLSPLDMIPQVEVFGQHEISELTKSREELTRLLERFVERDPSVSRRKGELKRQLERSRVSILDVHKEQKQIEERLSALPALEETLSRFQKAGLEERLKEQSLLVREERILKTATERFLLREWLEAITAKTTNRPGFPLFKSAGRAPRQGNPFSVGRYFGAI